MSLSIFQESPRGFYALVEGLLDDIFRFASLVPRVAKHHAQPDYLGDVDEIAELSDMRDEILSRVSAAINSVKHRMPLLLQLNIASN